jgi:RNA polymerase sigma factor (sigma-70 family)
MFRERPLSILGNNIDAQSTSPDTNPLDRLLSEENCHRLHVAVERLPVELQRLLRWRFRKGMTYKQIGERLQRSENDVRMLITRCLARVKSDVFPNGWSV